MIIELPFPPSVNKYYRRAGHRMHISNDGRKYKDLVYGEVLAQHGIFKPLTGPVRITVELHPPNRIRRDLDNFAGKALYDALVAANVLMDDDQIKESHNYWRETCKPGKCLVSLEQI